MIDLGDRVLDLQARVQLDEGERAVGPDEELERAGVAVADVRQARSAAASIASRRSGVERGRRRLLDHLLVPALDRALALAERDDVPWWSQTTWISM